MESVAGLGLGDLYYKKPVSRHVYEFSVIVADVILFFALRAAWHHEGLVDVFSLVATALIVVLIGKKLAGVLLWPWRGWMVLAQMLSLVMTPIIFTVAWCLLMIPFSILLKVLRIRVMETRFRQEDVPSYWMKRNTAKDDFKLLERQF